MLLLKEVVDFLEDIKNDYGWFLYSYDFQKKKKWGIGVSIIQHAVYYLHN